MYICLRQLDHIPFPGVPKSASDQINIFVHPGKSQINEGQTDMSGHVLSFPVRAPIPKTRVIMASRSHIPIPTHPQESTTSRLLDNMLLAGGLYMDEETIILILAYLFKLATSCSLPDRSCEEEGAPQFLSQCIHNSRYIYTQISPILIE